MGNWLSSTPSEGHSSPQCSGGSSSTANSNIQGNYSGNTGSNNSNCNININYGDTSPSRKHVEILQCLYTSRYESHRERVPEPVEGTCTWVTEHPKYLDWSEKKTSGLLWLSADPGCGKSVIASFLVAHLKSRTDAIVCYFFFKDDNNEQKSATFALCALLHQLFMQRKPLSIYAEEAFEAKGAKFTEEVGTLWDILVKAVVQGGCGDVVCVVDALDECEDKTLTPLIRHITHLPESQSSDTPLKFLVTSRPYHNIERDLGTPETTIRLKGEDEVDIITTDVTRVVDAGIKDLELYWRRPGGLGYLRNLLESSADGTFLWVSLVLGILKDSVGSSVKEFTNIVSTAPRDLAELYTKILDKSADPDKARRILNIVVAAARPLTLQEMNIAFGISRDGGSIKDLRDPPSGFDMTVKNLCGLFVRVIDSKIYLVHQTAREFLIRGSFPGQGNWQYTLCPRDSNFIMADICISYLSQEEFEGGPLEIGMFGRVSETAVRHYVEKYGFLDYAAQHWPDHFRDSDDGGMKLFEITQQICETGSNRLLTWLQVYWLNNRRFDAFPKDWTHMMIASMLGQGMVVERLLQEGADINAQCEVYGTALNIAAIWKDEGMTERLLEGNAKAYIDGQELDILHMKRSELERVRRGREERMAAIDFLKRFCTPDMPEPPALPEDGTPS